MRSLVVESLAARPSGLEGIARPALALANAVRVDPKDLTQASQQENGLVCENHFGKHDTDNQARVLQGRPCYAEDLRSTVREESIRQHGDSYPVSDGSTSAHSGKASQGSVNVSTSARANHSTDLCVLWLPDMGQSVRGTEWRNAKPLSELRTHADLFHGPLGTEASPAENCGLDADATRQTRQQSMIWNGTFTVECAAQPSIGSTQTIPIPSSAINASNRQPISQAFDSPNTQTQPLFFEICKFCRLRLENTSWFWLGRAYQDHLTRKCPTRGEQAAMTLYATSQTSSEGPL